MRRTIKYALDPKTRQEHSITSAQPKQRLSLPSGRSRRSIACLSRLKKTPTRCAALPTSALPKDKNVSIKTLSMAAIANDGHEGTITATVLYTGSAKPENLIPTFITPGTVTVNGAAQTSGSSAQDFRKTLTYLCTSRNGQYTRRYTVKIRFVYEEPSQSLLKTFRFPAGVNPLTKDSEGRIDQTARTVHISACYAGERPKKLIPEFSATGEVTVDGVEQTSGTRIIRPYFFAKEMTLTTYFSPIR